MSQDPDDIVTLETEVRPLAMPLHRRVRPSDHAIALAFWGRSHCQFHNKDECGMIEEIIGDAERIDRGETSEYYTEHGPGMRDADGKLIEE